LKKGKIFGYVEIKVTGIPLVKCFIRDRYSGFPPDML
jgi:hypothetical protein